MKRSHDDIEVENIQENRHQENINEALGHIKFYEDKLRKTITPTLDNSEKLNEDDRVLLSLSKILEGYDICTAIWKDEHENLIVSNNNVQSNIFNEVIPILKNMTKEGADIGSLKSTLIDKVSENAAFYHRELANENFIIEVTLASQGQDLHEYYRSRLGFLKENLNEYNPKNTRVLQNIGNDIKELYELRFTVLPGEGHQENESERKFFELLETQYSGLYQEIDKVVNDISSNNSKLRTALTQDKIRFYHEGEKDVHAEAQLLVEAIKSNSKQSIITSKLCCNTCYIAIIKSEKEINIIGTNGKSYVPWPIPQGLSLELVNKIIGELKEQANNFKIIYNTPLHSRGLDLPLALASNKKHVDYSSSNSENYNNQHNNLWLEGKLLNKYLENYLPKDVVNLSIAYEAKIFNLAQYIEGIDINNLEVFQEAIKMITSENFSKCIVPLKVHSVNKTLEASFDEVTSHWVGIYIEKNDQQKFEITYLDPMGHNINEQVKKILENNLAIEGDINQLSIPIQYAELKNEAEAIYYQGNNNDCGHFVAYLLAAKANNIEQQFGVQSQQLSERIGQCLRTNLKPASNEILQNRKNFINSMLELNKNQKELVSTIDELNQSNTTQSESQKTLEENLKKLGSLEGKTEIWGENIGDNNKTLDKYKTEENNLLMLTQSSLNDINFKTEEINSLISDRSKLESEISNLRNNEKNLEIIKKILVSEEKILLVYEQIKTLTEQSIKCKNKYIETAEQLATLNIEINEINELVKRDEKNIDDSTVEIKALKQEIDLSKNMIITNGNKIKELEITQAQVNQKITLYKQEIVRFNTLEDLDISTSNLETTNINLQQSLPSVPFVQVQSSKQRLELITNEIINVINSLKVQTPTIMEAQAKPKDPDVDKNQGSGPASAIAIKSSNNIDEDPKYISTNKPKQNDKVSPNNELKLEIQKLVQQIGGQLSKDTVSKDTVKHVQSFTDRLKPTISPINKTSPLISK